MKLLNFLILLIGVITITSCGWSEKHHQVIMDNITYTDSVERIPLEDTIGARWAPGHYESGKYIPGQYVWDTIMPKGYRTQPIVHVMVRPSRQVVFEAAELSGWEWQWKSGIFFLVAGALIMFLAAGPYKEKDSESGKVKLRFLGGSYEKGTAKGIVYAAALCIALGLGLIIVNPASKSGNNDKVIPKKQYEELLKTDPDLDNYFRQHIKNGTFLN